MIKPHMSVSQFNRWVSCPAKEFAVQSGFYVEPQSPALHGGKYLDLAILTSTAAAHEYALKNDMVTKKGELNKSSYGWCASAISRIRQCADATALVHGKTHVPISFNFAGSDWIGEIDCLPDLVPEYLTELKSTKSFDPVWVQGASGKRMPVPFYEAWHYWRQAAVYWYSQNKTRIPVFLVVTKHIERNGLTAIMFNDISRLQHELDYIEYEMPRILEWKTGKVVAPSCGSSDCEYCRGLEFKTQIAESILA